MSEALMSTKLQTDKKETKQVRVGLNWHKVLKLEAAKRGITMSRLHDEIYNRFFNEKR